MLVYFIRARLLSMKGQMVQNVLKIRPILCAISLRLCVKALHTVKIYYSPPGNPSLSRMCMATGVLRGHYDERRFEPRFLVNRQIMLLFSLLRPHPPPAKLQTHNADQRAQVNCGQEYSDIYRL